MAEAPVVDPVTPDPAPAVDPKPAPVDPKAADPAPAVEPKTASDPKAGYWPSDWQARVAGGDEQELKQLSRYASPEALWKKARSLEKMVSSGQLKHALPQDATDDDLKAWRKDNGIPDKPEAYDLKGVKFDEAYKPVVDEILKNAHAANFTTEQARAAVQTHLNIENARQEARAQRDEEQRTQALDALNEEWGGNFRRNVNMVKNFLSAFPESVRDSLAQARLPDGTLAFNHPDIMKGLLGKALELNPAGVIVPAGGGDLGKSMVERYNDIQKYRKEDRGAYNKDEKVQTEERQLIDALQKHGIMDANGNIKQAA